MFAQGGFWIFYRRFHLSEPVYRYHYLSISVLPISWILLNTFMFGFFKQLVVLLVCSYPVLSVFRNRTIDLMKYFPFKNRQFFSSSLFAFLYFYSATYRIKILLKLCIYSIKKIFFGLLEFNNLIIKVFTHLKVILIML